MATLFLSGTMNAATRTWTGGGVNNNWSTAAIWTAAVAPVANDDLRFPAGPSQLNTFNDLALGTSFNSITISGSNYSLGGNSLVTAAVTVNPGTVSNTVSLNATLASVSVGAGSTLTVSGGIT